MRRLLCGIALGALCSGACYSTGASDEGDGAGGSAGNTSGGSSSGGPARGGATGRGGSSNGGSATAGAGAGSAFECSGTESVFATVDKTCSTADDCVLVNHTADCCGTILIMGINAAAQTMFSEAEAYCSAQLPACGCAAQGTNLEDGTVIDFADTSYAVECSDGQCGSVYSGVSFACLTANCTQTQYCQIVSGGPAGSGSTGSCFPLGACSDCACINAVGCDCSQTDGNITVTCAAP